MDINQKITRETLEILSKEQVINHFLHLQEVFFAARKLLDDVKEMALKN